MWLTFQFTWPSEGIRGIRVVVVERFLYNVLHIALLFSLIYTETTIISPGEIFQWSSSLSYVTYVCSPVPCLTELPYYYHHHHYYNHLHHFKHNTLCSNDFHCACSQQGWWRAACWSILWWSLHCSVFHGKQNIRHAPGSYINIYVKMLLSSMPSDDDDDDAFRLNHLSCLRQ